MREARTIVSVFTQRPLERLAAIARARCENTGPAHDFDHVQRVVANATKISRAEGADLAVTVPAALLHELFNHPKGHPESHRSGEVCAEHARGVLREDGFDEDHLAAIAYAIEVHPFSRGITPTTLDAKVLQDADRLDAIGAIGIARCFATCTEMQRPFYNTEDPFCTRRPPEDKLWGIDHFYKKLLKIPDVLHTATAREMASRRVAVMRGYLDALAEEIT